VSVVAVADEKHPNASLWAPPNLLTLSRPLIGGVVWFVRGRPWAMFGLLTLGGLTDVLDGWLARRRARRVGARINTSPGVWLDPLCDKLFVLTALGAIVAEAPETLPWLPLVVSRELLLAPLWAAYRLIPALRRRRRYEFRTAVIGKITTVVQFFTISAFVFRLPLAQVLAVVAGISGAAAVVHYTLRTPPGPPPRPDFGG
jgi:phosphatidylglycerophosphate synthase